MRVSIVLADDHQIVRKGLRALLEAEADFQIVGEASTGPETVQLVERLTPDILVLDLMMPGLNGLEVARQVRQQSPSTRVIVLSMHTNEAYVLQALKNGASGYVLKNADMAEIVQAIHQVIAGLRYLSPPLSEHAINVYIEKARITAMDSYETLTEREREVLQLAAEGLGNNEIAARLSVSPRTIETHRAHLLSKLGLRTQTDLIRYALQHGLIE
jgi:two-component system, NarL family, response regulator NreC